MGAERYIYGVTIYLYALSVLFFFSVLFTREQAQELDRNESSDRSVGTAVYLFVHPVYGARFCSCFIHV